MEELNPQAIPVVPQAAPSLTLELQKRFVECWPASGGERVFARLLERYTRPRRRYHNLQHIQECLAWADAFLDAEENSLRSPAVELAIYFHDAVLSPVRSDNELRSSLLFQSLAPVDLSLSDQVRNAINATTHTYCPGDTIGQLVCDADLAVLGAPSGRYAEYAAAIRAEYAAVPGPVFRVARSRFLKRFLESPHLYHLEFFADQLEGPARRNMRTEIAHLSRAGRGASCGA